MASLSDRRTLLDQKLSDYRHAARSIADEKSALAGLRAEAEATLEARGVVQAVAQAVQQRAHEQVSRVVTRCLGTVFGGDAYEFRIIFERKRGRTEARLRFFRGAVELEPLACSGGGVVDVAAFALRLASLLLSIPRRRRLLVLDEPLKHLSRDHGPAVRELLEVLSKELGLQLLVVTHDPNLVAGKVVRVGGQT